MLFRIQIHPLNVDINITAVQISIYIRDINVTMLRLDLQQNQAQGGRPSASTGWSLWGQMMPHNLFYWIRSIIIQLADKTFSHSDLHSAVSAA